MSAVQASPEPLTARRRAVKPVDLLLVAAVFGASVGMIVHGGFNSATATRHLDGLGVVLAAGAALPLAGWRRWPLGALVLSTFASALSVGLGYPGGPPVGPTVALYLLALSSDERHPWTRRETAVVVALFALHFTAFGIGHHTLPATELAFGTLLWAVAWFAGDRMRLRRAEIAELERRAAQAEQTARRERQLAAAEERARIARDLHDSAGHAINVIAVHAGAARLLRDRDPDGAWVALETIERVARQTVGEIDQIVGGLRDGAGGRDPGDSDARPAVEAPPGLAALEALVAQHDGAGTTIEVKRSGTGRQLSGAVDQAAYRILQEALTNAARHGAGSARVELCFGSDEFELTVINPVTGEPRVAAGGHGLVGMRERTLLLAGELDAGRENGSFKVHAKLPYRIGEP